MVKIYPAFTLLYEKNFRFDIESLNFLNENAYNLIYKSAPLETVHIEKVVKPIINEFEGPFKLLYFSIRIGLQIDVNSDKYPYVLIEDILDLLIRNFKNMNMKNL